MTTRHVDPVRAIDESRRTGVRRALHLLTKADPEPGRALFVLVNSVRYQAHLAGVFAGPDRRVAS